MARLLYSLNLNFAIVMVLAATGCYPVPGTPEAAFHDFQTTQHKEGFLVLPLCMAGESVVPLVTEKVKDKSLDRRLYAIAFLGTSSGSLPVSVLESIVRDETDDEFRSAALRSLFALDGERGRSAAEAYKDRTDLLGSAAKKLILVKDQPKFRIEYRRRICYPDD